MMLDSCALDIQKLREELYLGKGYVVIRNAISEETIQHMVTYWNRTGEITYQKRFNKYLDIKLKGPDLSLKNQRQNIHYNFFWNEPRDIVSFNLAWQLQALRNQLEGQPADWGYLPNYHTPGEARSLRYISSYRVVWTQEASPVPPHSDWDLDHSKIQVSLMLTSYGEDYQGGGMMINDRFRDGKPINISEKENLKAGDLLLFRYAHTHSVGLVQPTAQGKGFGRMLMPLEIVDLREKSFLYKIRKQIWALALKTKGKLSGKKPDFQGGLNPRKRLVRGQGEALYYDNEVAKLMDVAIRQGLAPTHVYLYRGLWGRFRLFQDWQMAILRKHGLQVNHHVLDIGCGILRLGMALIPLLESDRYCGVDPVADYVNLGEVYLEKLVKTTKVYQLLIDGNFSFARFDRSFDFAMAQSVFTHLSFTQIENCFAALTEVMKPGGKFIFTVILGADKERDVLYINDRPLTKSSHSGLAFYNQLSEKYSFKLTSLEQAEHPTQQTLLAVF